MIQRGYRLSSFLIIVGACVPSLAAVSVGSRLASVEPSGRVYWLPMQVLLAGAIAMLASGILLRLREQMRDGGLRQVGSLAKSGLASAILIMLLVIFARFVGQ